MRFREAAIVLLAAGVFGLAACGAPAGQGADSSTAAAVTAAPEAEQESTGSASPSPVVSPAAGKADKIAVVNLDEGADSQSGKIYYAEKLVQFPNENFEYTSLNNAKNGIETGNYGAYIVIPADFSNNVLSLNSDLQRSDISYCINRNLDGKNQYTLLGDVVDFGTTLNTNMSYMYIANIMSEFHSAQDGVDEVIGNDTAESQAISSIQATDLIALVSVPDLKTVENTTETLSVDSYSRKNDALAQDLDAKYTEAVSQAQAELDSIRSAGTSTGSVLQSVAESIKEVNLTLQTDSQSNEKTDLTETGKKKVTETVAEETAKQDANIKAVQDNLHQAIQKINELSEKVAADDQNSGSIRSIVLQAIKTYFGQVSSSLPELTLTQDPNQTGSYVLSFDAEDAPSLTLTIAETENPCDDLLCYVENWLATNQSLTRKQAVQASGGGLQQVQALDADGNPVLDENDNEVMVYAQIPSSPADVEVDVPLTRQELLNQCDSDAGAQAKLQAVTALYPSITSVPAFMNAVAAGQVTLGKSPSISLADGSSDIEAFNEYLQTKMKEVSQKNYADSVSVQSVQDSLDGIKKTLEANAVLQTEDSGNGIQKVSADNLNQSIQDNYLTPLNQNVTAAQDTINTQNQTAKSALATFAAAADTYQPLVETSYIKQISAEMSTNNSDMMTAVYENNASYQKYADDVYQASEENVSAIRKSVSDANDTESRTLQSAVSALQNLNQRTSARTQDLMEAFSRKLPYTRLGSMESTQAYRFISNPVLMEDKSEQGTQ